MKMHLLISTKVLESIPKDWSVHMLEEFLIRSLRRSLDDYNESQIVLGLARGENLMVSCLTAINLTYLFKWYYRLAVI
jgi:hypothetical protein